MRITAIDFETANRNYESVCSIGIAFFENGRLLTSKSCLVKPHEKYLYFEPMNTQINGITEEDVEDEPEFNEVFKGVLPFLKDTMVIAHNAMFDMSVLKRVLLLYELPIPPIQFLCTYKIARKTWPHFPSYSLANVCKEFNHYFHHHDAKEDAVASGYIYQWALREHGVKTALELAQKTGLQVGCLDKNNYKPCNVQKKRFSQKIDIDSITPENTEFDEENQFYHKKVVFTGELKSMSRKDAMQRVVNAGGIVTDSFTMDVNYLVMGSKSYEEMAKGKESSKTKRAKALMEKGKPIQIIDENKFLQIIK